MHLTLLTACPRGEAAPYAALALGLRAAGYGVRLAGPAAFAPAARAHGLDYFAFDAASPDELLAEAWQACQGTHAIVYDPFTLLNGYFLARQMGVPAVAAALAPLDATAAHPAWPFYGGPRFGPAYNRLTHALARQAAWQTARGPLQRFWRQRAGIAPAEPFARQSAEQLPVLYGYSAHVLPRPADWPEHLHVTGDWPLQAPDDWRPPQALLDFLRAGPPPVYVSLPGAAASVALQAVAACGLRAVLQDEAGCLPAAWPLSSLVIRVDNVPQRWLFPRLAALLHAGDAASTAAGLRAGVPAVVVAHRAPLPAWGHLLPVHGLGLAAGPGANAARLAALLQQALADGPLRDRLARLSDLLEREKGVKRAVAVIGEAVR